MSLPDLQLHLKRKNTLSRLTKNPSKHLKLANLKFKLNASSLTKNLENLETLRSETNLKVDDFNIYLKVVLTTLVELFSHKRSVMVHNLR